MVANRIEKRAEEVGNFFERYKRLFSNSSDDQNEASVPPSVDLSPVLAFFVRFFNIEILEEDLGGDINAQIFYVGGFHPKFPDAQFVIILDKRLTLAQKNSSIGHEIGHILLHLFYEMNGTEGIWRKIAEKTVLKPDPELKNAIFSDMSSLAIFMGEELEADSFSRAILMPKREYLDSIAQYGRLRDKEYQALAERFNVPQRHVMERGRELGVL